MSNAPPKKSSCSLTSDSDKLDYNQEIKNSIGSQQANIDDCNYNSLSLEDVYSKVEQLQQSVELSVEQIQTSFNDKLAYDATKQQQIDVLHQELVEHRQNLIAKTIRPLVNGIIRMHDDLGRLLDKFQVDDDSNTQSLTPERSLKLLAGVQEDIEILLDQNGVMAFESPNEEFEPRRQSVVKKIPVDDPALVGHIALRVRPGFEQGQELIKKERVNVYVQAPEQAPQNQPEITESASD